MDSPTGTPGAGRGYAVPGSSRRAFLLMALSLRLFGPGRLYFQWWLFLVTVPTITPHKCPRPMKNHHFRAGSCSGNCCSFKRKKLPSFKRTTITRTITRSKVMVFIGLGHLWRVIVVAVLVFSNLYVASCKSPTAPAMSPCWGLSCLSLLSRALSFPCFYRPNYKRMCIRLVDSLSIRYSTPLLACVAANKAASEMMSLGTRKVHGDPGPASLSGGACARVCCNTECPQHFAANLRFASQVRSPGGGGRSRSEDRRWAWQGTGL